jgi:hypothetical protein
VNLNDNVIVGNRISGNGADTRSPTLAAQRMTRKETRETTDVTRPSDRLRKYLVNLLRSSEMR